MRITEAHVALRRQLIRCEFDEVMLQQATDEADGLMVRDAWRLARHLSTSGSEDFEMVLYRERHAGMGTAFMTAINYCLHPPVRPRDERPVLILSP